MYTPLKKIALKELCNTCIMLDANILMVGIEKRLTDANCSFENMKTLYILDSQKFFKIKKLGKYEILLNFVPKIFI